MNKQELQEGLAQYYGTEQWYRHNLVQAMLYTDGVKFFCENAGGGCFWWLDIIATEVFQLLKAEDFISVTIKSDGNQAQLYADDGNDNVIWNRHIDSTDCPEGEWKFFLTDNVLMIPSEY